MSAEFKKTFCTNVDVYFVGVWDCVASVGFIPRKLPFSKSPTNSIHYFRHAMALDEHRYVLDCQILASLSQFDLPLFKHLGLNFQTYAMGWKRILAGLHSLRHGPSHMYYMNDH